MIETSSILAALHAYEPTIEAEQSFKEQLLSFVNNTTAPCDRQTIAGHITASAWVLSPDLQSVLLIQHRGLNRWLQPGGHIEHSDDSLLDAALREVAEETLLTDLSPATDGIFDIDIHSIPRKRDIPEHLHFDVRYLFVAHTLTTQAAPTEVNDVQWLPLTEVSTIDKDESLVRMADKALGLQSALGKL